MTTSTLEQLADAVAERLLPRLAEELANLVAEREVPAPAPEAGQLVDAATLARLLGVSRGYVYEHAEDLGASRLGDGSGHGHTFGTLPEALVRDVGAKVLDRAWPQ